MSSLLAPFAMNIFWLGRSLERAENIARILHVNATYGRDDPQGPDWGRVLRLYADEERFLEKHSKIDAASVLGFYFIDRDNPTSISSSILSARQNARSVRHLISTEMWAHLNIFSSEVGKVDAKELSLSNLANIATSVIKGCQTFEGITEGTFLRSQAWRFYHIGRYLERADQMTRILDIGYDRLLLSKSDAVSAVQWNLLLRSVSAYHAYRSKHPGFTHPHEIAGFLLYDKEFPRAVVLCVDRLSAHLRDIERQYGIDRGPEVEKSLRALEFSLETGPGQELTPMKLHMFLDGVQVALGNVSTAIDGTYFK